MPRVDRDGGRVACTSGVTGARRARAARDTGRRPRASGGDGWDAYNWHQQRDTRSPSVRHTQAAYDTHKWHAMHASGVRRAPSPPRPTTTVTALQHPHPRRTPGDGGKQNRRAKSGRNREIEAPQRHGDSGRVLRGPHGSPKPCSCSNNPSLPRMSGAWIKTQSVVVSPQSRGRAVSAVGARNESLGAQPSASLLHGTRHDEENLAEPLGEEIPQESPVGRRGKGGDPPPSLWLHLPPLPASPYLSSASPPMATGARSLESRL